MEHIPWGQIGALGVIFLIACGVVGTGVHVRRRTKKETSENYRDERTWGI